VARVQASMASSKNINPHKEKLSICQHCRTTVNRRGQVAIVRKHFEKHCNPTLLQKRYLNQDSSSLPDLQEIKKQKNSNRDIQHYSFGIRAPLSSKGNFVVDL
jgi:hypothetical protein